MPLKRLTWSKTRGTARECQPAARGCRPALHLAAAAAAAAALPCPAHSRGPDASPRPAAARLHLRKPPRPPRQPQPGPAFEGRREPGAPRGWAGANPHLRLLLPSPPSPVRVLSGGVRGAQRPPNSAALAEASLAARVAYIRAPRSPHPLARATSCHRTPPPSGARAPAAAGLGRGTFVPGPAAAGSRSPEGAFSPRLRRLRGTRWGRCDGESQPAADPEALPDLADCKQ